MTPTFTRSIIPSRPAEVSSYLGTGFRASSTAFGESTAATRCLRIRTVARRNWPRRVCTTSASVFGVVKRVRDSALRSKLSRNSGRYVVCMAKIVGPSAPKSPLAKATTVYLLSRYETRECKDGGMRLRHGGRGCTSCAGWTTWFGTWDFAGPWEGCPAHG